MSIKKLFLSAVLLSFFIFNANFSLFSPASYGDTTPARLLPFNLFSGNGIYFDQFIKPFLKLEPENFYFFQKHGGHYLSAYPIFSGLTAVPIYLPVYLYLKFNHLDSPGNLYQTSVFLDKLAASVIAGLSTGMFFYLFFLLCRKKTLSFFFAMIFAFATPTFSVSSQSLWQNGPANLLLIAGFIFLLKSFSIPNHAKFAVAGVLFSVLAFWSRITFSIHSLLITLIAVFWNKKKWPVYFTVFLAGLLFLISFNRYFYGSALGGYHETSLGRFEGINLTRIFVNFLGVLFSPARGMIFYTPFFIFSLLIIFYRKKIVILPRREQIFVWLNYSILIYVLIYISSWSFWWGGHSWGDRLLIDGSVPAVILSYYFYLFNKQLLIRFLFITSIFIAVVMQSIGVLYYPNGYWNLFPDLNQSTVGRLWDLQDNPIARTLVLGPNLTGWRRFNLLLTGQRVKNHHFQTSETKCDLKKKGQKNSFGYQMVEFSLTNNSSVDWLTETMDGPNIYIKQLYVDQETNETVEPPALSTGLPLVIRHGQTVNFHLMILHFDRRSYRVTVFPYQEGVLGWNKSCSYSFLL